MSIVGDAARVNLSEAIIKLIDSGASIEDIKKYCIDTIKECA